MLIEKMFGLALEKNLAGVAGRSGGVIGVG